MTISMSRGVVHCTVITGVVFCRDGNERTGVFIAVWNSLDRLKTEQQVDVYHTVELMRIVRPQFIVSHVSNVRISAISVVSIKQDQSAEVISFLRKKRLLRMKLTKRVYTCICQLRVFFDRATVSPITTRKY